MDRLPEVAPEVVDVAELAGDAIAARAVNGAAVPLVVHGEPPFVRADPADLHEAIGNLVENATKYCKVLPTPKQRRYRDRGPSVDGDGSAAIGTVHGCAELLQRR
jgi:signal transduction histidine kinase